MSNSGKSAVIQTAAQRNKKSKSKAAKDALESNQTSSITAVVVAVALGAFLFWRHRDSNSASKRPGGSKAGGQSVRPSTSSLPRNKAAAGNKKKDKLRKREERDRRAEKRDEQANKPQAQSRSEQREPDPNNDKLILNYNHYVPNI